MHKVVGELVVAGADGIHLLEAPPEELNGLLAAGRGDRSGKRREVGRALVDLIFALNRRFGLDSECPRKRLKCSSRGQYPDDFDDARDGDYPVTSEGIGVSANLRRVQGAIRAQRQRQKALSNGIVLPMGLDASGVVVLLVAKVRPDVEYRSQRSL